MYNEDFFNLLNNAFDSYAEQYNAMLKIAVTEDVLNYLHSTLHDRYDLYEYLEMSNFDHKETLGILKEVCADLHNNVHILHDQFHENLGLQSGGRANGLYKPGTFEESCSCGCGDEMSESTKFNKEPESSAYTAYTESETDKGYDASKSEGLWRFQNSW